MALRTGLEHTCGYLASAASKTVDYDDLQADRQKLLQLLTGYELAVTGHEGYAKVREVFSIQHLFCRDEPRAYLGGVGSVTQTAKPAAVCRVYSTFFWFRACVWGALYSISTWIGVLSLARAHLCCVVLGCGRSSWIGLLPVQLSAAPPMPACETGWVPFYILLVV